MPAEVPLEQAQQRGVAVIDGGAGGGDSGGVLAAEAFGQQRQGTGPAAVGGCDEQAGIAHTAGAGAVGQQQAHQVVLVKQGQADRGFEALGIDGRLQFGLGIECGCLGALWLA